MVTTRGEQSTSNDEDGVRGEPSVGSESDVEQVVLHKGGAAEQSN